MAGGQVMDLDLQLSSTVTAGCCQMLSWCVFVPYGYGSKLESTNSAIFRSEMEECIRMNSWCVYVCVGVQFATPQIPHVTRPRVCAKSPHWVTPKI
ncbi:hypothetical protein M404DRAFT_998106 [Pisolithus tinctorius Marx 270]|uniref:Uncharacterized protein n=1 Tax=Pisolithus tinctorius Marx 270 TaxID=870435 RepID=A0A0C3PG89_PISTI|nr:hypothetical protein M404DRAFT_998106 [Pisolithus tinctorius Marx 270]